MLAKAKPDIETVGIIVSSTYNSRLRSYACKPLIQLPDGKLLVQHQIEFLKRQGVKNIFLTVGYESERVVEKGLGIPLVENQLYLDTGEAEDIRLALNLCNPQRIIILSGDLFIGNGIHLDDEQFCLGASQTDTEQTEIGFNNVDGKIGGFSFGFEHKWCGLVGITTGIPYMRELLNKRRGKLMMWEIIELLINKGFTFKPSIISSTKLIKLHSMKSVGNLKNSLGVL